MLDLIFPSVCCSCDRPLSGDDNLCTPCFGEIKFLSELSLCVKCGAPFGFFNPVDEESPESVAGHLCGKCIQGKFSFKNARSIALYDGKIRDMIHEFKYEGRLSLEGVLTDIIVENFPYDPDTFDVVVPVPLHLGKLRDREYNQSAVLANNLARRVSVDCNLLGFKKIRDTRPQFELKNEDERRRNVRGAFSAAGCPGFKSKSVLLVDDVFTTGSTSEECARELLRSGASEVSVITLARAKVV